ncbi:MAG TPA: aspartate-semialdehyde dehydrogenase [Coxiellaceae bacterium]|nr:MAG: aspartate-semialdehyde dehydrogenase [Gammaproteobacteria bacterium RIFCSPHIGHO2_12_FULL_36_30]HLB56921.1 aspartate-semialdehyde dehydrogenase [Coxiellaceae bacterium]
MPKKYNIAIVGATGIVGETLLSLLAERDFPVGELFALASEKSAGNSVIFKEKPIMVNMLDGFDFSKIDFAFFAAGNEVSLKYAPIAAEAGCIVIDKSSAFRYDKDVPLVVPEVNPTALKKIPKNIIANPNCNTIPVVAALKPIYDKFGIQRINISTYQSVSGAGKQGIEALAKETAALLSGQSINEYALKKQIAFNVIPKIDSFHENNYTLEEMKIVWETQKILDDKKILINPTAVRVPVFFGHSASVHIETEKFPDVDVVRELLEKMPGIVVIDGDDFPTPVTDAASQDAIFVGRIRNDISHKNGINLWVVADNVRKGAALNAIQIAELLTQNSVYRH